MKANEFVKKVGWDKAKEILENAHWKDIAYRDGNYYSTYSKNDVLLGDLKRLVESHELIESGHGLETCKSVILFTENNESEYGNQLGVEYKKSSENPNDKALMLCDDDAWINSSYLNHELDTAAGFVNFKRLKQAIADEESCQ
ncbi:hypothetical protein [Acinetobacter sp. ANC 4641]|uniref:hypothetical protein n=1 Tax=Acinetobacter sp. ANC 4641 TaxID=2529847 RepID=UPI00103CD93B|nr:hypothetical protein [Acinetobacter sp. ANC 4641]TCB09515.1 hypothetical protein E0H78_10315 [Acinetobacter sp. ANC 4641]